MTNPWKTRLHRSSLLYEACAVACSTAFPSPIPFSTLAPEELGTIILQWLWTCGQYDPSKKYIHQTRSIHNFIIDSCQTHHSHYPPQIAHYMSLIKNFIKFKISTSKKNRIARECLPTCKPTPHVLPIRFRHTLLSKACYFCSSAVEKTIRPTIRHQLSDIIAILILEWLLLSVFTTPVSTSMLKPRPSTFTSISNPSLSIP